MKVFLLSICLCLPFESTIHEYIFSHTDIIEKETTVEISCNIFIDDLDNMFETDGFKALNLGTNKEDPKVDSLLNSYIKDKLKLIINDQVASWDWIGKEVSEDLMSFWIYLEVPKKGKTNTFSIENKILTETIGQQKNIVNVLLEDNTKRYLLFQKSSKTKIIK